MRLRKHGYPTECECGTTPCFRMTPYYQWQVYCRGCGRRTMAWGRKDDAELEWEQVTNACE